MLGDRQRQVEVNGDGEADGERGSTVTTRALVSHLHVMQPPSDPFCFCCRCVMQPSCLEF
jgi:hypothetical protein